MSICFFIQSSNYLFGIALWIFGGINNQFCRFLGLNLSSKILPFFLVNHPLHSQFQFHSWAHDSVALESYPHLFSTQSSHVNDSPLVESHLLRFGHYFYQILDPVSLPPTCFQTPNSCCMYLVICPTSQMPFNLPLFFPYLPNSADAMAGTDIICTE